MSSQPNPPPSDPLSSPVPHRGVLDDIKRRQILAILTCGGSRRMAARYVGCSPATISRTAAREPQFAEQLAHAEANLEIESLRTIRNALKQERYWRAAAWVLERKNPMISSKRSPRGFTTAQVFEVLAQILATLGTRISDEDRRIAMDTLGELVQEFEQNPDLPRRTATPGISQET